MSTTSLISAQRLPFAGKTDYYGNRMVRQNQSAGISLDAALTGEGPYNVTEGLLTQPYIEDAVDRLRGYRLAWDFYRGKHFNNPYDEGELKTVVNFTKKVVDIAVDWFVAKGWSVSAPAGNEQVAEAIDAIWEANQKLSLTSKIVQLGGITGDSFCYVTVKTKDAEGKKLPKNEWRVKLNALNPAYCFPFWRPDSPGALSALLIQYPLPNPDTGEEDLYSILIEPTRWRTWINDAAKSDVKNPFGAVNCVHIPNFDSASSNFGMSDIGHIISLNNEYNGIVNSIRKIIKYHAEPTTLVFGAKLGDIEKGVNKVWSGFPENAKVENLQLDADLAATYKYLEVLEKHILELSNTPKILFDSAGMKLSNTSGLAMQMTFQPIIEKTRKRQISFTQGVKSINELILTAQSDIIGVDFSELADDKDQLTNTWPSYTSPLPRDEKSELDAAKMKVDMGIWSKAEAIRRLSDVDERRRLSIELAADERYKLLHAKELFRAQQGETPNLAAVFTGSASLSEDLEELAGSAPDLDDFQGVE